jgi:putative integral membrane protein (TIGR02587 family)
MAHAAAPTVAESLREYGRGFAGGLLFSLPLLYTMEVWWAGFIAGPGRLLVLLAITFVLLLAYNRFAGMRHDASWLEVAIDSVEELGLGLVTAAGMLFLLGRIGSHASWEESFGKIVVEAAVVAIGFSVGTAQLGVGSETEGGMDERKPTPAVEFLSQVTVALCGAVLFAANVAPTEEVLMIAVEQGPLRTLGIAALSIAVATIVLSFIEFAGARSIVHVGGKGEIVVASAITYAVALAVSAMFLWFFGRFAGMALDVSLRQVVVLALPASLGASAGRFLLQL